jgi:hypothetical protein
MRSTKDLKDIVTDVRGRSKGRFTETGKMALAGTTSYVDQVEEEGSFIAKTSNGSVTYGMRSKEEKKSSADVSNYKTTPEEENRNAKLALLALSDKDTIETQ